MQLLILFALVLFAVSSSSGKDCDSDPEPGICLAAFDRYYYDSGSNSCKHFIYGGCRGNGNNYETIEECEKACKLNDCTSPKDGGICYAYFPMFYFDTSTGSCKSFVYGGCGGNGNRYGTRRECLNACVHD